MRPTARCHRRRVAPPLQAELLLAALVSAVLAGLVLDLDAPPYTWVLASFFLICTTSVLRLRWLAPAALLAAPVALAAGHNLRLQWLPAGGVRLFSVGPLPADAVLHLAVAWAVGALTGYLSDANRRQAFANHHHALAAAAKELAEVRARGAVEQQLAAARALAEAKSAENEAKSEFVGMLCHELRTPLNGCLASAEMLLQTELDVSIHTSLPTCSMPRIGSRAACTLNLFLFSPLLPSSNHQLVQPDQRDLAHTVRVSGSILLSTVSSFLDHFKLEAGKPLGRGARPLDLRGMVADVHRIAEAMVPEGGGVELLPPDLSAAPPCVLGDPSRMCGIALHAGELGQVHAARGDCAASEGGGAGVPPGARRGRAVLRRARRRRRRQQRQRT